MSKQQRPYRIGLTGNIACGKSLVLGMLAELGADVIDADQVSREVTAPGEPALEEIRQVFGSGVFRPDGTLDRRALGAMVFRDPEQLRRLEAILHPRIAERIRRWIAASDKPVVVIDAIKLFESSLAAECDETWVVTCHPEQQLARLMARDGFTREEALLRIHAQPPQEEKVRRATRVIDNSGTVEETRRQVLEAWHDVCQRLSERSGTVRE